MCWIESACAGPAVKPQSASARRRRAARRAHSTAGCCAPLLATPAAPRARPLALRSWQLGASWVQEELLGGRMSLFSCCAKSWKFGSKSFEPDPSRPIMMRIDLLPADPESDSTSRVSYSLPQSEAPYNHTSYTPSRDEEVKDGQEELRQGGRRGRLGRWRGRRLRRLARERRFACCTHGSDGDEAEDTFIH